MAPSEGGAMANVFTDGSKVWAPDDSVAWEEGVVNSVAGDSITVSVGADPKKQKQVVLKASECCAREESSSVVDDMVTLSYLHEPGVLNNLMLRYQKNLIYTYTGSILIAANPFMRVPGLYTQEMKEQYRGAQIGELSPHVFAIADNAYRAMIDLKQSQSILISGESGAGKTETTKLVMEYLASIGGRSAKKDSKRNVESQVLESNPLLEAFGNAKTVRNDNSSRFGKFIEIQFDKMGRVSGAAIRSYLLERSRVVQIADPERNYHCFYQLCAGATDEEVERYRLPAVAGERARQFHYLNQSQCFELEKIKDAEEYHNTRHAMDVIGITKENQESIFGVVAAILHLGNLEFKVKGDDELRVTKACDAHLAAAAHLLGCNEKALKKSLCTVTRKVGGEVIQSYLDVKSAIVRRDTLAKTIYSKLFDWIVQEVNQSIGQDPNSMARIGVLDIYGFEHFKNNSFEQFCINLANEKLQQHFNQHVLKLEQEEYEAERINWSYINFKDNQDVLDLVEGDNGILTILDSACKLAQTTAEGFTLNLYERFLKHERFSKSKGSVTDFTLAHYAGKVKYLTDEFIAKNMDAVVPEHEELLKKSSNAFIAAMFPEAAEATAAKGPKFNSIGKSFKSQLGLLMETLNATEPHYIRCIKPNSKSRPMLFEKLSVMEQLRSGGVLEAIRMCSAGYPTRRLFADFVDRFALLVPGLFDKPMMEKQYVELILGKAALENWQIGLTKVFLRAGQMVHLESLRLGIMNEAVRKIQRAMRLFLFRLHRARAAAAIQTYWRGYAARKRYAELRRHRAATTLQRYERMRQSRIRFLELRSATVTVQTAWRGAMARDLYKRMRRENAAVRMQRHWKGYHTRKPYKSMRRMLACRVARLRLKNLRIEKARQAELAPPRKKTEVAAEVIRLMVVRVQRNAALRELEEVRAELREKEDALLRLEREAGAAQQSTGASEGVPPASVPESSEAEQAVQSEQADKAASGAPQADGEVQSDGEERAGSGGARLAELEGQLREMEEAVRQHEMEVARKNTDIAGLTADLDEERGKLTALSEKLEAAERELQRTTMDFALKKTELARQMSEVGADTEAHPGAPQALSSDRSAEGQGGEGQEEVQRLGREVERLREELEAERRALRATKVDTNGHAVQHEGQEGGREGGGDGVGGEEIERLHRDLQERTQDVAAKSRELGEASAALEGARADVARRDEEVAVLRGSLEAERAKLASMGEALAAGGGEAGALVQQLQQEAAAKAQALEEEQGRVRILEKEFADREQGLAGELAVYRGRLQEVEREVGEKSAALEKRTQELAAATQALEDRERDVVRLSLAMGPGDAARADTGREGGQGQEGQEGQVPTLSAAAVEHLQAELQTKAGLLEVQERELAKLSAAVEELQSQGIALAQSEREVNSLKAKVRELGKVTAGAPGEEGELLGNLQRELAERAGMLAERETAVVQLERRVAQLTGALEDEKRKAASALAAATAAAAAAASVSGTRGASVEAEPMQKEVIMEERQGGPRGAPGGSPGSPPDSDLPDLPTFPRNPLAGRRTVSDLRVVTEGSPQMGSHQPLTPGPAQGMPPELGLGAVGRAGLGARTSTVTAGSARGGFQGGRGAQPSSPPSPGSQGSHMHKVYASMQREVELAGKMKEENKWLRVAYKDALAKAERAMAAAAKEGARAEEGDKALRLREAELEQLQGRLQALQEMYNTKVREVRGLMQRLAALQAASAAPVVPVEKQQEILLSHIRARAGKDKSLAFTEGGVPVVACVLYKSLLHWKTMQAERTNTFDRIIDLFQNSSHSSDSITNLSYWLTNHCTLYYLVEVAYKMERAKANKPLAVGAVAFSFFGAVKATPPAKGALKDAGPEPEAFTFFKQQLWTGIDRLYVTIRDTAKQQLTNILNASHNPAKGAEGLPGVPEAGQAGGRPGRGAPPGVGPRIARTTTAMVRATTAKAKAQSVWEELLGTLQQCAGVMGASHVPPFLLDALLRQLLGFINTKMMNSLMVRSQWCPCTYSNGEVMGEGLARLDQWVNEMEIRLKDTLRDRRCSPTHLDQELRHIRQAVFFLTLDHKPMRSLEEIKELCPDLSTNQLVHMCIWYEDDIYGTKGVDPGIIEQMWSEMLDESPMLLKDDEIPFAVEDLVSSISDVALEEVEPPADLQEDPTFHFLIPLQPTGVGDALTLSPDAKALQNNSSGSGGSWDIFGRSKTLAKQ